MKTKIKNSKKGISLIVLVITIIVMIILASTIILNLSGVNIIERANEAVRNHNRQQITTVAQTIWSEGYLANRTNAAIKEEIVKEVGKNKADDFNIIVTDMGVIVEDFPEGWEDSVSEIVNGVPIPKGFVISPYNGENTVNEGLVIYALTETEIDEGTYDITKENEDHQLSLENRDQFVWVPVDRNTFSSEKDTEFKRDRFEWDIKKRNSSTITSNENWYSKTLGSSTAEKGHFWEVELDEDNMPKAIQSNMNYMSDNTLKEVQAMYASVKKYGGFYIARYEVGASDVDDKTKFGRSEDESITVTMGKYPYNGVPWASDHAMSIDSGGAVELARKMYKEANTKYGVISTLTYGVQWDRTVAWMKSVKGESFDLLDSTEYGNYSNTKLTKDMFNENAEYVTAIYNKDNIAEGYFDVGTWTSVADDTEFPETRNGAYIMTTGALAKANICNIYDMAGNMIEWTMEGCNAHIRVRRGGWFQLWGSDYPIVERGDVFNGAQEAVNAARGFRPSLYIK